MSQLGLAFCLTRFTHLDRPLAVKRENYYASTCLTGDLTKIKHFSLIFVQDLCFPPDQLVMLLHLLVSMHNSILQLNPNDITLSPPMSKGC